MSLRFGCSHSSPLASRVGRSRRRVGGIARFVGALLAVAGLGGLATPAQADPSAFDYGYRGFGAGALAGVSVGYLIGRAGGWHSNDWRALVISTGVGALVGGGGGLGLGFADASAGTPGRLLPVIHDAELGALFGATAGALGGMVAWAASDKPERILLGAAIGGISGVAVGAILGAVESSNGIRSGTPTTTSPSVQRRRVQPALAAAALSDGSLCWLPALQGRY